tara:strand:- start:2418 stop:2708 length:291 start_codon:yes stop_codon:yes gene_type:complete
MDSIKKPKTFVKRVIKTTEPKKIQPLTRPKSLSEGFSQVGLKAKKLGVDWRFSNGATLVEDQTPNINIIPKIVEYMKTHTGTNVTVTIASILKGAR